MDDARVTYAEVRQWAVWLREFDAEELAGALGAHEDVGARGVLALLFHGICERVEGNGRVRYLPLPPGPREHPHGPRPEDLARAEMGGDPLGVVRGFPIPGRVRHEFSRTGLLRPGRRQMRRRDRRERMGR